jgi:DNA-binding beta-propeller fold protein YncE
MTRRLLALSKGARTMSILDPDALEIQATVPTGEDSHEVLSPDGRTAYVSNFGSGRLQHIDVVDVIKAQAIRAIDTGPLTGPHGLAWAAGRL